MYLKYTLLDYVGQVNMYVKSLLDYVDRSRWMLNLHFNVNMGVRIFQYPIL
jgi:hypothetical protein